MHFQCVISASAFDKFFLQNGKLVECRTKLALEKKKVTTYIQNMDTLRNSKSIQGLLGTYLL